MQVVRLGDEGRYRMIKHASEPQGKERVALWQTGHQRSVTTGGQQTGDACGNGWMQYGGDVMEYSGCTVCPRFSWDGLTSLKYERLSKDLQDDFTAVNVRLIRNNAKKPP